MSSPERTPEAPRLAPAPKRGGLFGRLSAGHIVMIVAALLAALVNLNLLQSRDETFLVSVAAQEILPGQAVELANFRSEEIRATGNLLDRLILFEDVGRFEGLIAVRSIAAGDLVGVSDFQQAAAPLQQRAMSIPVDEENAVGGAINTADRVDVIAVNDGVARYVVVGAPVLATPGRDESGFTPTTDWFVTIAVSGEAALELASALDTGEVHVVRSTGADTPAVELFDPAAAEEEEAASETETPPEAEDTSDGGS